MKIRLLAIGDIVGRPGREILREKLPAFCREKAVDGVIANAENIAGGAGITPADAEELFRSGVTVITAGDHVWNKQEIIPYIASNPRLLRPVNYPVEQPGRGASVVDLPNGVKIGVVHVQGRVFMNTHADCPFATVKRAVEELRRQTPVIVVDVHCEATSEKIGMGWWLDGKVSFIFGTHTHVQTADDQILPQGTAYITDVGMTGPYDGVIGRRTDRVLHRFTTGMPARFDVAEKDVRICGAMAVIDAATGRAENIERVTIPPFPRGR